MNTGLSNHKPNFTRTQDLQKLKSSPEPENSGSYQTSGKPSQKTGRRPNGVPLSLTIADGGVRQEEISRQQAAANGSPGEFAPDVCASPRSYELSESSSVYMKDCADERTPPESPVEKPESPDVNIGRLSLEQHGQGDPSSPADYGWPAAGLISHQAIKRSASSDLRQVEGNFSPYGDASQNAACPATQSPQNGHCSAKRGCHARQFDRNVSTISAIRTSYYARPYQSTARGDSGYVSTPSRASTLQSAKPLESSNKPAQILEQPQRPECIPVSEFHLEAEARGIYAGLVQVEAKCISIDAAQSNGPITHLGADQWQALIALHRTLLYEHHDFLMATMHPAATPALRALSSKYSMPARMWRHGIHAFLEVLRHRRPQSQEFMIAFVYLAYQMMGLLLETVPYFLDTWIECLGDLARYRMAIEDDKEAHAQWGGVAARWYTLAADRHPKIGRLNHHLGILERPSLRKLFYYAKSLTCVVPFPNARDSLTTLCSPIVKDEVLNTSIQSAEPQIVTLQAMLYSAVSATQCEKTAKDALELLASSPTSRIRAFGVSLAVTNIATLFEFGRPNNAYWQAYASVSITAHSPRTLITADSKSITTDTKPSQALLLHPFEDSPRWGSKVATCFCYSSINCVLQPYDDRSQLHDVLPFVHVMLVWQHSQTVLQSRLYDSQDTANTHDSCSLPVGPDMFAWSGLAEMLNSTICLEHDDLDVHIFDTPPPCNDVLSADSVTSFTKPPQHYRPLAEDFSIRGLIWAQWYFPPGWFDAPVEDTGRTLETLETAKGRVHRVLGLGLWLVRYTKHLCFNQEKRRFWAPVDSPQSAVPVLLSKAQQPPTPQIEHLPNRTPLPHSADDEANVNLAKSLHAARTGGAILSSKTRPAERKKPKPPVVKPRTAAPKNAPKHQPLSKKIKPQNGVAKVLDSDKATWS